MRTPFTLRIYFRGAEDTEEWVDVAQVRRGKMLAVKSLRRRETADGRRLKSPSWRSEESKP